MLELRKKEIIEMMEIATTISGIYLKFNRRINFIHSKLISKIRENNISCKIK